MNTGRFFFAKLRHGYNDFLGFESELCTKIDPTNLYLEFRVCFGKCNNLINNITIGLFGNETFVVLNPRAMEEKKMSK